MNPTSTVGSPGEEAAARPGSEPERPGVPDTADATGAGPEGQIPKDDLFHLLQNSRRRAVLWYLRGREGPVRMRDVAEQVAAWEHDTTVAALSSDERQRVYVALYQSHLDALADAGVIEYEKSRGVIEPRPLLDRVAAYTDPPGSTPADGAARTTRVAGGGAGDRSDGGDRIGGDVDRGDGTDGGSRTDHDEDSDGRAGRDGGVDAWDRRYLGVSAVGSALLTGTALDVGALQSLPGVAAGSLVLLAFAALTAAKLVVDDRDTGRSTTDG